MQLGTFQGATGEMWHILDSITNTFLLLNLSEDYNLSQDFCYNPFFIFSLSSSPTPFPTN